jgi:ABC-type transport system involved in cytochrome c biogenesis permease subunit
VIYFFSQDDAFRKAGVPLAILGCAAQFAQLAVRFETTHVWPLLNLYGSLSLFSAMSVAIYIGFAFRYRLWFAGGFVLALAAIFLAYGVTWYEGTMPPVPSLQSYWAKIHVPIVVSSYAAFLVAFVFSCIYLVEVLRRALRHKARSRAGWRLFRASRSSTRSSIAPSRSVCR